MTRRAERRRRLAEWAAIVAAGAAVGVAVGGIGWAALAAALWLGHRRMVLAPGVAVLTYHSVARDPAWLPWAYEIAVAPETLARHLDALAAAGCNVLSTADYLDHRARGMPMPPRPVVLHFDDGYRDNWLAAAPLLRARGMPATFFASLDFIEPGDTPRDGAANEAGYMNWGELRALAADPQFAVEPHGIDHARIPLSDRTVDVLTPANWRRHAWMQWAETPGPKHDWHREQTPTRVPVGTPVPESGLSLASRAWRGGAREDRAALEARIADQLARCRDAFAERLGQTPTVFCWPENVATAEGRAIAATLGFRATTGGKGRNTAAEPPATISRIHMGDRALGFRWLATEALHVRAATRLAHGNLYWYLVLGPMNGVRRVATWLRERRR